ncbi:MAG: DUF2066 domain-containing protein [Gammaproteobacteria bacterium]
MRQTKLFPLILCGFILSGFIASTAARVVDQLTLARVPVADRSDIEFARGTSKALELVLIKLTGSSRTPKTQQGRTVLAKAQRLVQQFGYEKPQAGNDSLLLRVEFDPEVLTNEMRASGLVLWGKERPETLLFVVVNEDGKPSIISSEDSVPGTTAADIRRIIVRQAQNRGIPVSFPDPAMAALVDANGGPTQILESVLAAGQSSGADGIAVAIFEGSRVGLWEARWLFQIATDRESFSNQGDLVALLAEEATDSLADIIGRRYANPVLLGYKESVQLRVTGLYDAEDFARVTQYLQSLDNVENLFIQQANGDIVEMNAVVQGGYTGLEQSIAFGKILAPVAGRPGEFRLTGR